MSPQHFRQIEELLAGASELPAGERGAWLDAACSDPALRTEVEALLAAFDAGEENSAIGSRVREAAADIASGLEHDPLIGELCGDWRIERLLGQGGMGTVYLGVRESDEYRQKAAIKLLRFGPAAGEYALDRLRQERRILAGLEHPNITRLIDGGAYTTPSGARLPYIAMEYVDGEPLLVYAESHQLGLDARIALFRKICNAVQFAHQNLIVHRDLKPGNILVTGDGEPKLLDFGIARLIEPITGDSQETATRVFTPDYASPEQIRGAPPLPASDIYSLGAILYQLLTLQRPFERRSLAPAELERLATETEAIRPSVRGGPFAGKLAGDLDNIVAMALRADPLRRYKTAGQLAEDLDRYSGQLPVMARADTFFYRTSKQIRRHWTGFAAAAIAFLALAIGLGVALFEARIANERFQDVRSLANTFLFDFDKEIASVPGSTRARQMLAATARKYLDSLSATARNDEGLLTELATSYEKLGDIQGVPGHSNLGLTREAGESYGKAIAILERLAAKNPKYRARLAGDLGVSGRIAGESNQTALALELVGRAAELTGRLQAESPKDGELLRDAARGFDLLASIQQGAYRSEDAKQSSGKAVALLRQGIPADAIPKTYHTLALALHRLGLAHRNLAEFEEAAAAFHEAQGIENRILSRNSADSSSRVLSANLLEALATLDDSDRYPSLGNAEKAIGDWGAAVRIYSELAAADGNDVRARVYSAGAGASLALIYHRRNGAGDARAADRASEDSANALEAAFQKAPRSGFARSRRQLVGYARAVVMAQEGRCGEAVGVSRQALDVERAFTRESGYTADNRLDLGGQLLRHAQVLVRCGEGAGARQAGEEAAVLFNGLQAELKRWMAYAYQAGAYRLGLAHAMETFARESSDAALLREAAANYDQAAGFWSPWQAGHPYMQQRVAEAVAARDRCLK